uniref:Ferritin n=1 Tax=Rhizophora mucronata TaxID=61149 RepID=A0A2P2JI07_RHIMU
MLAKSVTAFAPVIKQGDGGALGRSSSFLSPLLSLPRRPRNSSLVVSAAGETSPALTGLIFQPFEEIKKEAFLVPITPQVSLARQYYVDDCEAAINEQINVEYGASYVYHAMFAYFDRDNIALKGLAKFFQESSEEEREHAEKLMKYQNIRGGRVQLYSIINPPPEYEHPEKGDALYGEIVELFFQFQG